jgi:hypothetical protein
VGRVDEGAQAERVRIRTNTRIILRVGTRFIVSPFDGISEKSAHLTLIIMIYNGGAREPGF